MTSENETIGADDPALFFEIGCPQQGVSNRKVDIQALRIWIGLESEFWKQRKFGGSVISLPNFGISRVALGDVSAAYVSHWDALLAIEDPEKLQKAIEQTMSAAKRLDFLLAEGLIAKRMVALLDGDPIKVRGRDPSDLKVWVDWATAAYSTHLLGSIGGGKEIQPFVDLMTFPLKLNPGHLMGIDAAHLEHVLDTETRREDQFRRFTDNLLEEIEDRRRALDELDELYRTKLALEAPAEYWQDVAKRAGSSWRIWLFAFVVCAVAGPIGLAIGFWGPISSFLTNFLQSPTFGVAVLLSLVGITYGWFLKHLSRGFVQNLQTAEDARQRRVMAMTFLGLSRDERVGIGEAERALILNALFRPATPASGDEGPPAGILDLIRSR